MSLPFDVIEHILDYCGVSSWILFSRVNKEFRKICREKIKGLIVGRSKYYDLSRNLSLSTDIEEISFYIKCGAVGVDLCAINSLKKEMYSLFDFLFPLLINKKACSLNY